MTATVENIQGYFTPIGLDVVGTTGQIRWYTAPWNGNTFETDSNLDGQGYVGSQIIDKVADGSVYTVSIELDGTGATVTLTNPANGGSPNSYRNTDFNLPDLGDSSVISLDQGRGPATETQGIVYDVNAIGAIPEPSSAILALSGMAILMFSRFRKTVLRKKTGGDHENAASPSRGTMMREEKAERLNG